MKVTTVSKSIPSALCRSHDSHAHHMQYVGDNVLVHIHAGEIIYTIY